MQYTVTSRGRPIGTTELGAARGTNPIRIGWFHPNVEGARLLPVVTSAAATRAFVWHADPSGESPRETERRDTALLADVAEAVGHADALALEILRDDGSLVPTEDISINDVEEVVSRIDRIEPMREGDGWRRDKAIPDLICEALDDIFDGELDGEWDAEFDGPDELEPPFDLEDDDDLIFGGRFADAAGPWTPELYEPDPAMRYQICVTLVDSAAIP